MKRKGLATLAAGLCLLAAPGLAAPASAASNGSANGTVALAVRSITVTATNPLPVSHCWASYAAWQNASSGSASPQSTLPTPNGYCTSGVTYNSISITNGPVSGHVNVQGTNATGSGGTGTWTLVGTTPATDQFGLATLALGASCGGGTYSQCARGTPLATSAACDTAIHMTGPGTSDCAAAANQTSTEDVGLTGPSASTGTAPNYTFTVTWIAVA